MDIELSGGATHYLLCHISVKPTNWVLRREFPVAPTFQPSGNPLFYTELDSHSRSAIHDHLKFLNGGENDLKMITWVLSSCWRLKDSYEWFSFAIVLQCLPVARGMAYGTIKMPNPKPRVLYHMAIDDSAQNSYYLEHYIPISSFFDPALASGSSSLIHNYDLLDPGARDAVLQIMDHANDRTNDRLNKPWGLYSISRIQSAKRGSTVMVKQGYAVVLEWQPGPSNGSSRTTATATDSMSRLSVAIHASGPTPQLPPDSTALPPSYTPTA